MRGSLRDRLAITLALTAFASVAITTLVSVGLVRNVAAENARRDLERVAHSFARAGAIDLSEDVLRPKGVGRVLEVSGDQLAVVRRTGVVVPITEHAGAIVSDLPLDQLLAGQKLRGTVGTAAGEFVYVGLPVVRRPFGTVTGAIVLARSVDLGSGIGGAVVTRVLLAAGIAALIALGVSTLVARRLVRPVEELSRAATRIAHGDLAQRVPVESQDEIGELAHSFNDMSEALAEAQRREREFLANVSHELRTPITAIRGYAEALEDGAVRDEQGRAEAVAIIRSESTRLERMVEDVLDLARLGAGQFTLQVAPVDLVRILTDVVGTLRPRAAESQIDLGVESPDALMVDTDADRVHQIVSNLLQNAIRVTPSGGRITVSARETPAGASIEVSDTGPGIATEDLPHVFERSYLWRASRGKQAVGTGLGLAIVRELATALEGRVEVESDPDAGTTFRVSVPRSPRARA